MTSNKISSIRLNQPTCPWWFLFTFDNPLRKFYQDPEKILSPYLKPGDRVVDIGCGMGYFTIPMAKIVQENGKVIAVDMQSKMLTGLRKRADRAGVGELIELHQCTQDLIGITGPVDFVLAFWMVHEIHHLQSFLEQIFQILKDDGQFLIAEPYIHVTGKAFHQTVAEIKAIGFSIKEQPSIGFSRSILAQKGKGKN